MTAMQNVSLGAHYAVHLLQPDDFAFWRERARMLIQSDVPPDRVSWVEPGGTGDLFAQGGPSRSEKRLPIPDDPSRIVRASKRFLSLAKTACHHSDPARFTLLYRLLWRLQNNPRMMEDKADPDVRRLEDLEKAVRRDAHKMHAFVRFRRVEDAEARNGERFIAWYEPSHRIVEREAGFFHERFPSMDWSILTPDGCAHQDGTTVTFTEGVTRAAAPDGDELEELWCAYYASIFNPARVKLKAMTAEMPKKFWSTLPETQQIPDLLADVPRLSLIHISEPTRPY